MLSSRIVRPLRAALLAACVALLPRVCGAIDCSGDSTGLIPLIDLGSGLYQGFEGGLYAGGSSHRPDAHNAAGVTIAQSIVPLDTLGNPDPAGGRVVLISIGMSNATQEFRRFVPKATGDPQRNPRLLVIDCAQGGQAAGDIDKPEAAYWDTVAARLRRGGSSPAQVQAVWLKEANRAPTGGFPESAESLEANLGAIARILHQKLPHARLCYLTSRIYAGYATTTLNPEPYAYESGFAVKWLIETQIQGVDSLEFDPARGTVESPWLAWGPYLWADGLEPRSDGLVWPCNYFDPDGTHPGPLGEELVADSLLAFFKADETTVPWFVNATVAVQGRPTLRFSALPSPAAGSVRIEVTPAPGEAWSLEIANVAGRRLRELAHGVGDGSDVRAVWDGRDARGTLVQPGVYWIRFASARRAQARSVIWIGSR